MRRNPVILALTALVAAGLVGCASGSGASASCTIDSDAGLLDLVDVSGEAGVAPGGSDVTVRAPFHVSGAKVAVVERGDGEALTDEGQLALIDVTVYSGETGESVVATRYVDDPTQIPTLSQLAPTFPTLTDDLHCATEGSRIVVGLAPDDIPEETAAGLSLVDGESVVLVVDLRKVYLPKADGADQFTESHGLPTVVRAPDGRPGIIVPDATAPDELVVQTLKRGDGAEVTGDVPVRAHVTTVGWDGRDVVSSTWEDGTPTSILPSGTDAPAYAEPLIGLTVGSQVLVVVPADETSGTPATATVIDILGLDE